MPVVQNLKASSVTSAFTRNLTSTEDPPVLIEGLKWYEALLLIVCLSCVLALCGAILCLTVLKRHGCLREKTHICCRAKMHAAKYHNMTQSNPKSVPSVGCPRPTSIVMEGDSRTKEGLMQLFRKDFVFSPDEVYHSAKSSAENLHCTVPYHKRSLVAKHILLSSLPTIASAASASSYTATNRYRNTRMPGFDRNRNVANPHQVLSKYHSFDCEKIPPRRPNLASLRAIHSVENYLQEEFSPNDDTVYVTAKSDYHLDHHIYGGVRIQDVFSSEEQQAKNLWLLRQGFNNNNVSYRKEPHYL